MKFVRKERSIHSSFFSTTSSSGSGCTFNTSLCLNRTWTVRLVMSHKVQGLLPLPWWLMSLESACNPSRCRLLYTSNSSHRRLHPTNSSTLTINAAFSQKSRMVMRTPCACVGMSWLRCSSLHYCFFSGLHTGILWNASPQERQQWPVPTSHPMESTR